ncbi:terminase small subunit [Photobacterium profundum]|uniref:Terminase small subunit n=1 Tax=Photobacterium profundum (strain SS9) TaxID=298386 RepID=Q6LJU2_PHOPR|nr:terminase small subunit [Photobacterium profundum]CAG22438.1 hypothetical protein PBPRB0565 [Photobacterium profundum SS9]
MPILKTKKHELFCFEYVACNFNGAEAARNAGYSEKGARQRAETLLKREDIQDRIDEMKAERVNRLQLDADFVLLKAHDVFQRCSQEVRPVTYADGTPVKDDEGQPVYQFDSRSALKALELIGKHTSIGAFKERVEHSMSNDLAALVLRGRRRAKQSGDN